MGEFASFLWLNRLDLLKLPAQPVIDVSAPTQKMFFCLLLLTTLSLGSL